MLTGGCTLWWHCTRRLVALGSPTHRVSPPWLFGLCKVVAGYKSNTWSLQAYLNYRRKKKLKRNVQITSNFITQQRLLFTFGGPSVSPLSMCGPGIFNLASCFSVNIVKHFPLLVKMLPITVTTSFSDQHLWLGHRPPVPPPTPPSLLSCYT